MNITKEEAVLFAADYGLENEIREYIDRGYYPEDALYEWDLLPIKICK